VRRIAISGLLALAAVLGGAAVPAAATTRPAAVARIASAATPAGIASAATPAGIASAATPAATSLITNTFPKISCLTGADCLAVIGSSSLTEGTSTATAISRWNGSTWKRAHVALPKGTRSLDLNGVSCKGAKSCLVVGDYYTSASGGAPSHALALIYNGTSLKPMPAMPLPKSATDVALIGVSCTTTKHCVAIGTASGNTAAFGADGMVSLIETWNGAKWTLHTVGMPANTDTEFSGISCATSAFCVLAGESFSFSSTGGAHLYIRSWNGKKLTVMKPAALAGGSKSIPIIAGVSCAKPSNCGLTGAAVTEGSGSTSTVSAITELWNGTAWRTATVAWPAGTTESIMLGVSCFGAHACEVGGTTGSGAPTDPNAPGDATAASYNGTSWTIQSVPAPAAGRTTIFSGVSCLTGARCNAVGETGLTTATKAATMTGAWNGTAWKLNPGF
jgi:hypothetical protein